MTKTYNDIEAVTRLLEEVSTYLSIFLITYMCLIIIIGKSTNS